jgi:hypothetical protein
LNRLDYYHGSPALVRIIPNGSVGGGNSIKLQTTVLSGENGVRRKVENNPRKWNFAPGIGPEDFVKPTGHLDAIDLSQPDTFFTFKSA